MMGTHVVTYIKIKGSGSADGFIFTDFHRNLIDELTNEITDWKFYPLGEKLYGENHKKNLKFSIEFPPEIKYFPVFKEQVKEFLIGYN